MPVVRVALVLVLLAATASADPSLEVRGDSDCPAPEMVEHRLQVWAGSIEGDWRVDLDRHQDRADVVLHDREGRIALRRSIRSDDCEALARAFDVILRTHFRAVPVPAVVETGPIAKEPAVVVAAAGPPTPAIRVAIDLHAGLSAATGPEPTAPEVGAAIIVYPAGWPLAVRAGVDLSAAEQRQGPQMAGVSTGTAHLSLGPSGRMGAVDVSAAVGLALVRVRALDLPGAGAQTRTQPTAGLGFGLRRSLRSGADLALRLDGRVYLQADRYIVEPLGVVGASPRFELLAAVGVVLDVL